MLVLFTCRKFRRVIRVFLFLFGLLTWCFFGLPLASVRSVCASWSPTESNRAGWANKQFKRPGAPHSHSRLSLQRICDFHLGFGFSALAFELSNLCFSLNTRLWCITIIYPRIRCVRLDEKRLWSKNSVLRLESAEHKLFSEQIKLGVSPDDTFHSMLFVLKVFLRCYSGHHLKHKAGLQQNERFEAKSLILLCGQVRCKPCGREQIK